MNDNYSMGCVYAGPEIMDRTYNEQRSDASLILDSGNTIALVKSPFSIGRSENCDLVIHNPAVSRNHVQLIHLGDRWFLYDDGSVNGTQINNVQAARGMQYELHNGDIISLSGKVSFRFMERTIGAKWNDVYPFNNAEAMDTNEEYNDREPIMRTVYGSPEMMWSSDENISPSKQKMKFLEKLFKRTR